MHHSPLRLVLANLLGVLLLLGLLEAAARLLFPEPRSLFEDPGLHLSHRPFVEPHPTRGFALVPGYRDALHRFDAHGLRGAELPGDLSSRFVLLAVGDSQTFGWGVRDGETYPSQLQRRLDALALDPPALVVNAGVPSYSSTQVRLYLDELLTWLAPQLVIVSVLWNDLWYSMVDGWYPELLVFRQPDAWRRLLMDHSGLFRAIALRRTRGVPSLDRSSERALAHYLENLERIVELARAAAAGVVLLAPPFDPGLVDAEGVSPIGVGRLTPGFLQQRAERYAVEARALATRLGVPWAEHRLAVGSPPPPGLFIDFLHPSPVGHRVLARDLARWLVEQGLLPRTPAPGSAALRPGAEPRRPGAGPASPADPAAAEP